jgi:hypothetical protein
MPVLIGSRVCCSVFLKHTDSGYVGIGLGQPNMTRKVLEVADFVRRKEEPPAQSVQIVKIPALYETFIARISDGHLLLTPVLDMPSAHLHKGEEVSADLAFTDLVSAARNYHASRLGSYGARQ